MTSINREKEFAIKYVTEIKNGRLAPIGTIERRTFLFIELVKNMDIDACTGVCIFAQDFRNLFIFTEELHNQMRYLARYDRINIITNIDSRRLLELGGCVRKLSEKKSKEIPSENTTSFALFSNNCSIIKPNKDSSAAIACGDKETYVKCMRTFRALWKKSSPLVHLPA